MFKDIYSERKCIGCDGLGYCEESTTTNYNKSNIDVKVVHNRTKCHKCNGSGKEKYIIKYALFKKTKEQGFPYKLIRFDFLNKHVTISAEGWKSIFTFIAHYILWKLFAHKIFKKLKIPYEFYRIDYDGDINFDFLSYRRWGGSYMSPDHFSSCFGLLGFDLRCDWIDEGKWTNCKKCDNPIPDSKDFKDKLCPECKYPKDVITIEGEEC